MKISIFKNAVSAKDFVCSATKGTKALVGNPRVAMVFTLLFVFTLGMFAQNTAGDYSAGTTALGTVTTEIAKYVPVVVKLCYAIAAVLSIYSATSIYIKLQAGEEGFTKSVMVLVGSCLFMIGATIVMPAFFGFNFG